MSEIFGASKEHVSHVQLYALHLIWKLYLQEIVIRNLDYIFMVSSNAVATASPEILVHIEKLLDMRSTEPWSYRRLPTPTATFPAIVYSEEENSDDESPRTRDRDSVTDGSKKDGYLRFGKFLQSTNDGDQELCRKIRVLRKKLQQIEVLEAKQSKGHVLDDQQIAKLQTRPVLESSLAELGVPIDITVEKSSTSVAADSKASKVGMSKKQRRKNKQKVSQTDAYSGPEVELNPMETAVELNMSNLAEGKVIFLLHSLCV